MATYSKVTLQPAGSTGTGLGIPITATTSGVLGTTLHQGSATATTIDEVWIWVVNYDTVDRKLTLQWGGITAGTNEIEYTVKAENGLYLIAPGLLLQGNATPLKVSAYAATGTALVAYGYVNRIA